MTIPLRSSGRCRTENLLDAKPGRFTREVACGDNTLGVYRLPWRPPDDAAAQSDNDDDA